MKGGYPRTSERLAEGNVEAASDFANSYDSRNQPRITVIRQVLIFINLTKYG
jgi:hypothetical protein